MSKLRQFIRAPSMESLFVAAVVLFGFRLGARPIGDNSAFTHLRTGIDIARTGAIPRADPYSYTARGQDWVVQSWFPEWTYGWAYRLGGFKLVVLEQAVLIAVLAWLVVRLARAGTPLRTALAGIVAVGVGTALWSARPLLFGLICMALTITVVERRRSAWLLIPVVWLWVNSHGSFPLGLAWLGARALGEGLDWRAWPRDAWKYVGGFAAGLVASILNPLGLTLLAFPLTLGEKSAAFRNIVEWRSPDFSRGGGYLALTFLALALLLLLRARLSWRDAVPVVAFLAAALLAARNIGPLAIVLAPVLGRAARRSDTASAPPGRSGGNPRMNRAVLATIAVAFVVFGTLSLTTDPIDTVGYPVRSVTWLDEQGLLADPHRLAHQEVVGNYLTLRYGTDARVFIDDRFDMYPLSLSKDYRMLLDGGPETMQVLERRQVDVVLWMRELPLAQILLADGWREIYGEKDYVVLQR
ncbi:MAG: hypothetical protein M3450_19745 [Actinomycetota bacterium]|nr:hypothetical protein [Actinomycetota bacterium]